MKSIALGHSPYLIPPPVPITIRSLMQLSNASAFMTLLGFFLHLHSASHQVHARVCVCIKRAWHAKFTKHCSHNHAHTALHCTRASEFQA